MDILLNENGKSIKSLIYKIQMRDENLYYIYSKEEKGFREIEKQDLIEMQEKGILEFEMSNEILNDDIEK